jgi:hypothetical protein
MLLDANNNTYVNNRKMIFYLNLIANKIDTDTEGVNLVETVQNLKFNPVDSK